MSQRWQEELRHFLPESKKLDISFRQMDAQNLQYEDESFDVVLSRNLSWTLPDPEQAYRVWHRVLHTGGILLNFDANYGDHVRSESLQNASVAADSPYGHLAMTAEMAENFFSILKTECIYRHKPKTLKEANDLIDRYIHFYNNERIQSQNLRPCEVVR